MDLGEDYYHLFLDYNQYPEGRITQVDGAALNADFENEDVAIWSEYYSWRFIG